MKKYLLATVLLLALVFTLPQTVYAHVLKTDGSMGAVLHINPDDNPRAGVSTDYVLSFSGDSSFSLPDCDCGVNVIEDGQKIASQALKVTSRTVSENTYIFPKPDVYTLEVTGSPKKTGQFQPFKLSYEVRVAGDDSETSHSAPPLLTIAIGLDIGLVLLVCVAYLYNESKNHKGGDDETN